MTLADFHQFCASVKTALDTLPEGSTGALLLISGALHGLFVRLGVDRLATRLLGPTLAATVVSRLPVLLVSVLWGWLTTGQLTGDDAARGLVTGLLGPMIVSGLAKRPPSGPSSGVTTGSAPGAPPHPSPSSLGASVAGPVVTLLLRSRSRLTTKRAGLTRPSSLPRGLFVGVNKMVAIATGAALIQGCAGRTPAQEAKRQGCIAKAEIAADSRANAECFHPARKIWEACSSGAKSVTEIAACDAKFDASWDECPTRDVINSELKAAQEACR